MDDTVGDVSRAELTRMTGTASRTPRRGSKFKTGWLNVQEVGLLFTLKGREGDI